MTPQEAREWFETWRGTHYDVETGQIILRGSPPRYATYHELAHRAQHENQTWLFRLWMHRLPLLHRLVHILLELDADRRARRLLRQLGENNALNRLAARLSLIEAVATFFGR